MNNNSFTNILLVLVLLLLVGFGVWYFTMQPAPTTDERPGVEIRLEGGADDGTSDQGSGGR